MRPSSPRIALLFCITFSLAVLSNIAQAQTFTVLHAFTMGFLKVFRFQLISGLRRNLKLSCAADRP